MSCDNLKITRDFKLQAPVLLMGLTGWMDGGNVSSATIKYLVEKLDAHPCAQIDPRSFYILNMPGTMELTSLFRPAALIRDGELLSYDPPSNQFYCDPQHNLLLFLGTEPHLNWSDFIACIFEVCKYFGVEMVYFIGSVAGVVPHTRQPRISCVVSNETLTDDLEKKGFKLANYEGPSSLVTQMVWTCEENDLSMATLVTEIPAYIQGHNPKSIDEVTKRISALLNLNINHDDLKHVSDDFEKKVTELVQNHPELSHHINKLEQDYDNEVFDNELEDMKKWLQQQGIRVD